MLNTKKQISVLCPFPSIKQTGLQLTTGKCGSETNAAEGRLVLFASSHCAGIINQALT